MGAYNTSLNENIDHTPFGTWTADPTRRFQNTKLHKLSVAMEEFCRDMSYWILHATIFFVFYTVISLTAKEGIKLFRQMTKKQPKPINPPMPDDIQIIRRRPGTSGPTSV